jgi:GAF domain-containing protein
MINESDNFETTVQNAITQLCKTRGWPVGHAYFPDCKHLLVSSPIWHVQEPNRFKSFQEVTENTHVRPGFGIAGRTYSRGSPLIIPELSRDPFFLRRLSAEAVGLKSALAFPIVVQSRIVAVLEFFSEKTIEPEETLYETMSDFGVQIGQIIEQKKRSWLKENRFHFLLIQFLHSLYLIEPIELFA